MNYTCEYHDYSRKIYMRTFITFLIILMFFSITSYPQAQIPIKAIGTIFKTPKDTVPIGTAFVAGISKSIYTCSHVVIKDTLWFRYISSNQIYRVSVKYNLPSYDVALLQRTAGTQPAGIDFGDFSRVQPGDTVFYIGWDSKVKDYMIQVAIVSAKGSVLIEEGTKVDFIEFEGEAIPGYSGGPVFNSKGKVIAMIREGWTRTSLKGGPSVRINRAFSTELLRVIDSELKIHSDPNLGKSPRTLIDLSH